MLTDALLQLSSAQAVTATAVSTNTIDLSQTRDIGVGNELCAAFTVDVSAAAAGAATVEFQVITSASANLSTPTVIASSGPIAKTELTAGRRPIFVDIAHAMTLAAPLGQRYLGVQYTVAAGPLTAGSFTASITWDDAGDSSTKFYPSGYTVA